MGKSQQGGEENSARKGCRVGIYLDGIPLDNKETRINKAAWEKPTPKPGLRNREETKSFRAKGHRVVG